MLSLSQVEAIIEEMEGKETIMGRMETRKKTKGMANNIRKTITITTRQEGKINKSTTKTQESNNEVKI